MTISAAALKSELTTDPTGIGYAAAWANGTDWQLRDLLNAIQPSITVFRGTIDGREIVAATTPSEFLTLTTAQQNLYIAICSASGGVDTSSNLVRSAFAAMFGANTSTRAALVAIASRNGSRAEQIFGAAVALTDIAAARLA